MEMVLLQEPTVLNGCVSNMSPFPFLPTGRRLRCFGRREGGKISSPRAIAPAAFAFHPLRDNSWGAEPAGAGNVAAAVR